MDCESQTKDGGFSLMENCTNTDKRLREAFVQKYKTDNFNFFDAKSRRTVFENILTTPNSANDIKWCVENGANLYACNESKRYPIINVIDSLCPENFKAFLEHYKKSKINVKYEDRNSLHLLISIFEKPEKKKDFGKIASCIKLLIDAGCDPNVPNKDAQTPFFILLRAKPRMEPRLYNDLVQYFLQKTKIDVFTYRSEEMIQMMNLQGWPMPEKVEKVINADFMQSLIDTDDANAFIDYFQQFKESFVPSECWTNDNDNEDTAMFMPKVNVPDDYAESCAMFLVEATKSGMKNIVELLLKQGVDVNRHPRFEKPAAFLACSRGNHEILELLLNHKNASGDCDLKMNFDEKNLLHEVCSHFGFSSKTHEDVDQNYQRCFELLMSMARSEIDINHQDKNGMTPLYYAIRYKNDEATKALLRKCYVGSRNIFHKAQIYNIRKEVFEEFLNECVTLDFHEFTDEQKITIDFNFLVAPEEKGQDFFEEIAPLEDIANNTELRPLILHPVLSSFLYLKWIKLSILFYTNLFFFFIFMGSFTTYIVLYEADIFFYISLVSLVLIMAKEIMQCYLSYKNYFKSQMNWFEMGLIVLIWYVLLDCQYFKDHLRVIRGVTILLCSFEFLYIFGDLPNFSVHIEMLKQVFLTFLKSIAIYSVLIVGFAFCFNLLYRCKLDENATETESYKNLTNSTNSTKDDKGSFHSFNSSGLAILKTIVMFTGELDAGELELDENDAFYSLIFLLFVFLVTIVLLNLINGLSITDIMAVKAEGRMVDLCQKIHVLNKYERIIMSRPTSFRFLKNIISIFPEFVQHGKIEIDCSNKFQLNSQRFQGNPKFEKFYNILLKAIIRFENFFKHDITNEAEIIKEPEPNIFKIQIGSEILKGIKDILEKRDEEKRREEKRVERIDIIDIQQKLRTLMKMDEKLERILNAQNK